MPPPLIIEVRGLDALLRKLDGKVLVDPAMHGLLTKSSLFAERQTRQNAPRDTGALARSISSEVRPLAARVFSPLAYATVMEFGRRPGARMPPPEALRGWARRKGYSGSLFVLARAIARRGIKGRFFMRKAAKKLEGALPGFIRDAARDIERRWGR
jgi:hypothetical protein